MNNNPLKDFDKDMVEELPEDNFIPINPRQLDKEAKKQMNEFGELLSSLDKTLDKKKRLWKQIYENAVTDRKNAYLVFTDLYIVMHGHQEQHAIHGQSLARYMERMSKATDQLIKLAELVAAAEDKVKNPDNEDDLSEEDYYKEINKANKKNQKH